MNGGEITFSGRIDELDDEIIEITFVQPFYVSTLMRFWFEEGEFILLIKGDEFVKNNRKYQVETVNYQFKISPNKETSFMIIAKDIKVMIRN